MSGEHYLVIDFEATCCDKGGVPREEMEIIEIGAVMVDAATLGVVDEFQTFIRPIRHPKLTPFCIELTSIRQGDIDDAPPFAEAITVFKTWLSRFDGFAFCSWGDYDHKQLQQDCGFHQVPDPINAPHINVKRVFAEQQSLRKRPGLGQAIGMAGLTFSGTAHRGIDDARNIVRLLPYIFGGERIARQT